MKKSETWQLAIITLVALAALFVDLNIEHPEWLRSLLFWRPAGQRDIRLHLGLDLQGGLQVLLAADAPQGQELDATSMETTRRVVENRVRSLGLTASVIQVLGERHIIVELPDIQQLHQVTDTIQATGLVEFVDAGTLFLTPGTVVETTSGEPPGEEPATPVTPTIPTSTPITPTTTPVTSTPSITPTAPVTPTALTPPTPSARVFETVLSSDDLEIIALYGTGESRYTISFALTQEATDDFTVYTGVHSGQYLCIALDKAIVSCASLPDRPLEGGGGIPAYLLDEEAQSLSVLLRYGPLPVSLQVEEVRPVGPSLGDTTIERIGRAAAISLVAVFLFLPLHYRLPGLLADLALLVLALFDLALCRLIPLPLTMPGVAGFTAAALLAIGGHLSIFECLREEVRVGRSLSRAVEVGFSRAWPSIRDVHLVLLVLSITAWYIGVTATADAIHWLGVTLLVGVLTSLFVTMVVTRTFARLTFDAAREWLSERKWPLGV